jgi:hypothetical protein
MMGKSQSRAFLPTDIAGLQFDLDPDTGMYSDAGTTLATNGGSIQQANDQSGLLHHASQATSGKRPLWRTNIVNGHAVVEFDGVDDYLKTASFTLNQPETIFLVVKQLASSSNFHYFIDGDSQDVMGGYGQSNQLEWRIYAGVAEIVGGPLDLTAFHVLEGVFNGASSLAKVDGNAGATGNAGPLGGSGVTLGSGGNTTNYFTNYQLARALVYAGALDATQRSQLRSHLGTRYGVTVA